MLWMIKHSRKCWRTPLWFRIADAAIAFRREGSRSPLRKLDGARPNVELSAFTDTVDRIQSKNISV